MRKLLLVDGMNLLFQMFFGMPRQIKSSTGKPVHAIYGFAAALFKTLEALNPTHLLIIFDGEAQSKRAEQNPLYKANRIDYAALPEEENPVSQLAALCKTLDRMDICYTETDGGYEADDVIAGYAALADTDMQAVIFSHDSDLMQLANEYTSIYTYRGKDSKLYTKEDVLQKFGVFPHQIVDFKALVGDSADNICGVPKIGPKTAAKLLQTYESNENILQNIAAITQPSIRQTLLAHANRVRENVSLIRLTPPPVLPVAIADTILHTAAALNKTAILEQVKKL